MGTWPVSSIWPGATSVDLTSAFPPAATVVTLDVTVKAEECGR